MAELVLAGEVGHTLIGVAISAVAERILAALRSIRGIGGRIKENRREADALLQRTDSIQPSVREFQRRRTMSSSRPLDDLLVTVNAIRDAVNRYDAAGALKRARNSKTYAKEFARLHTQLDQRMNAAALARR